MLTLSVLLFGAYMSRRVHLCNKDGTSSAAIDHAQIWSDLIAMFALIGTVCGAFVSFSRASRGYFDGEIQPWLERRGITLTLPTIDLPRLPGMSSEVAQ